MQGWVFILKIAVCICRWRELPNINLKTELVNISISEIIEMFFVKTYKQIAFQKTNVENLFLYKNINPCTSDLLTSFQYNWRTGYQKIIFQDLYLLFVSSLAPLQNRLSQHTASTVTKVYASKSTVIHVYHGIKSSWNYFSSVILLVYLIYDKICAHYEKWEGFYRKFCFVKKVWMNYAGKLYQWTRRMLFYFWCLLKRSKNYLKPTFHAAISSKKTTEFKWFVL